MSVPPPDWHNRYLDDEAARRAARLDSSRVRRVMAGAVNVLLVLAPVAIVLGIIFLALGAWIMPNINGPE